jgi:hypothetical protein
MIEPLRWKCCALGSATGLPVQAAMTRTAAVMQTTVFMSETSASH